MKNTPEPTGPPREEAKRPRRRATILVVDDDEQIREWLRKVLEGAGYEVLLADSGEAVPGVLGAFDGTVDVLLTDVVMPALSGLDVSKSVVGAGWATRVVFMSGHGDAASRPDMVAAGAPFLAKPFTIDDLLRTVREILPRRRTRGGS